MKFAVEIHICRGLWITLRKLVEDAQLVNQRHQLFGSLRAARTSFYEKPVNPLALNHTADSRRPLQQQHVDAKLLQSISACKARDARADHHYLSMFGCHHSRLSF